MLWSLIFVPVSAYGLIVLGMVLLEAKLVFPAPTVPQAALAAAARQAGAEELALTSGDGTQLYGWRYQGGHDRAALFFGGNGSTVSNYGPRHARFVDAGFDLLQVNYRGYPGSEGRPTEDGVLTDARAAWELLRQRFPADRILVFGKSMGGGVAIGLIAGLPPEEQPGALVVESTFTSTVDVAARGYPWLPVRLIMRHRMESLARAPRVRCPVVVLHSRGDEMIPFELAERLAAALPHAALIEAPALPHNEDLLGDADAWSAVMAVAPERGGP